MKRMLKIQKRELYYYKDSKKIVISSNEDLPNGLTGDISGLTGDISGLYGNISGLTGNISGLTGNISGLYGDISGLYGNISGLYGNISGLYGNIDLCEITEEERKRGIKIEDLILGE